MYSKCRILALMTMLLENENARKHCTPINYNNNILITWILVILYMIMAAGCIFHEWIFSEPLGAAETSNKNKAT
jgi:flagellar basal body-associated protein FliL